jgi:hypothetical protein
VNAKTVYLRTAGLCYARYVINESQFIWNFVNRNAENMTKLPGTFVMISTTQISMPVCRYWKHTYQNRLIQEVQGYLGGV